MRLRHKQKLERWGEPRTYTAPNGAEVEYRTENVGYGFTQYRITGTREQIESWAAELLREWPEVAYCTKVYWPPEQWRSHPDKPLEIETSPGTWVAKAWRSNTCD